jgi:predicted amidohydrolase
MSIMRVGLVKAVPERFDVQGNWSLFEQLVRSSASQGVHLFCSPEAFLDGYAVAEDRCDAAALREVAQDVVESTYIAKLKSLAQDVKAHIVFGFSQRLGEECYNAAALVDPGGGIVGIYHKTHLQSCDLKYAPGKGLPIFHIDRGALGIMICADRRWPETARVLRVQGAQLLLTPSYGMWHEANEWWMRTRSYENEVHICFIHPKVALITDPLGNVSGKLQSNVPDVLVHDVDLDITSTDHHLVDRRTDLYGPLVLQPDGFSKNPAVHHPAT